MTPPPDAEHGGGFAPSVCLLLRRACNRFALGMEHVLLVLSVWAPAVGVRVLRGTTSWWRSTDDDASVLIYFIVREIDL